MVGIVTAARPVAVLAGLGLLLGAGSARAQEIRTTYQVPLRLMDLSLAADTISGVQLLMQPSERSKQGKAPGGLVWLRFQPDSVLEWINSAASALRVLAPHAPSDGIQWSRALVPRGGHGALAVGRVRKKGRLEKGHWLAIADSTSGWRAELRGAEADSLLKLLLLVASQSRLDTGAAVAPEADRVDLPATIVHQPPSTWREATLGRVVASYVVGVDGRAELESFTAYLASDPALLPLALDVLRGSRFNPARRGGQPTRQRVHQVLLWRPAR